MRLRLMMLGLAGALAPVVPAAAVLGLLPGPADPLPAPARPSPPPVVAAPEPEPPPPPAPPAPGPPAPVPVFEGSQIGAAGLAVLELEERLAALGYPVGEVNGLFDGATHHAVMAFQKVEGLPRTGMADAATLDRLHLAQPPEPAYATPADHLEVDVARQVVLVVRGGVVTAVVSASTGTNQLFTSEGWTRRAITPNGVFEIGLKVPRWQHSPLGELYKPSYFNGGIAFHGSPSVPAGPASHGCVRLPMQLADWFYEEAAPPGAIVYVYGSAYGEDPLPL